MEGITFAETLSLRIVKMSDGWLEVRAMATVGEGLDAAGHRWTYHPGVSAHRVCDDATRIVCAWAEWGALGMSEVRRSVTEDA